jgi:hypothetical protein
MGAFRRERIIAATAALLFSLSPAFAKDNALVRHIDILLDFVGFVTANCVQHYEEGLKPEAVAKLHFSETEIATYCVCSTIRWRATRQRTAAVSLPEKDSEGAGAPPLDATILEAPNVVGPSADKEIQRPIQIGRSAAAQPTYGELFPEIVSIKPGSSR